MCIRAQNFIGKEKRDIDLLTCFIEAEEIKNRLKEMKLDVVVKKSKEMEIRHANEVFLSILFQ